MMSDRSFLPFDIDSILCYHGGLYQGDSRQALLDLTGSL